LIGDSPLDVLVVGENGRSLPWELFHGLRLHVVAVTPAAARLESAQREGSDSPHCVVDLTGLSDRQTVTDDLIAICRSGFPVACTLDTFHSLYEHGGTWYTSVHPFLPWFFEPVMLEFRRSINSGVIGSVYDIAIRIGTRRCLDAPRAALATIGFFAEIIERVSFTYDTGMTRGSMAFDAGTISVEIATMQDSDGFCCTGSGRSGRIEGSTDKKFLRIAVAGGDNRLTPLPEGDGSYYFMRELVRAGRTGESAKVLPITLVSAVARYRDRNPG
jgi:hypothetical protein